MFEAVLGMSQVGNEWQVTDGMYALLEMSSIIVDDGQQFSYEVVSWATGLPFS